MFKLSILFFMTHYILDFKHILIAFHSIYQKGLRREMYILVSSPLIKIEIVNINIIHRPTLHHYQLF